jgi:hypothetical protein
MRVPRLVSGRCRLRGLLGFVLTAAVLSGACSRSHSEDSKQVEGAGGTEVEPILAQAVGRAIQPCIRAHQSATAAIYTAELRLDRTPSGTAAASFLAGRSRGYEDFEACAVKAIGRASIPLATATTIPVAFDFRANR